MNKKTKFSIEIKRQRDDNLIAILNKDGKRTTLPVDSPELDAYRASVDFMKEQLLSMNAGSVKLSC